MKRCATLVALLVCAIGSLETKPSDTCNRHRTVLTGSWGVVTDGNDNYRNDSHCEWLIRANSSRSYITLKFREMDTECAYDHVFVYDGDSYGSPLLGSFSGTALPPAVTAASGSMLLLLYSDTNYVLKGFVAEYSVTDCPLNCSGNGQCVDGVCVCWHPWSGRDCSLDPCPERCNQHSARGNCSVATRCLCAPDFSGAACSLPAHASDADVGWHLLSRDDAPFTARASHAAVYVPDTDQLYVFGGRSLERVLSDFLVYNFNESRWHDLSGLRPRPAARWGHAMALHSDHTVVLHGGETGNGSLSSELWFYNVAKREWRAEEGASGPPPVAMHSLTLVDERWLYLFGGRTEGGAFSGSLFRIDPRSGPRWEPVSEAGPRVVGHAAAFDAESRSLLVHGGVVVDYARFSKLSAALWLFNVDHGRWARLQPLQREEVPMERAFHAAAVVGGFLLLVGGYVHRHSKEEKCFDDGLYLYHLRCHRWASFRRLTSEPPTGESRFGPKGLHSHAAVLRRGHTLLVLGGYRGLVTSEFWALHLPSTVTSGACTRHETRAACLENPACAWCSVPGTCLDRRKNKECPAGHLVPSTCPGLCPALRDCQSCMVWGQAGETNAIRASGHVCGWCVQASGCHPISEPLPECRASPGVQERGGLVLASLEECRTLDFRPGLLLLRYRNPVDLSQPDEVSYVNSTGQVLTFAPEIQDEQERGHGEHVGRMLGYLRPRDRWLPDGEPLRLFLNADGRAVLRLGVDDEPRHLDVVGNHSARAADRTEAARPGGQPLLLPPRGGEEPRYLMDFRLHVPVKLCHKQCSKKFALEWNAMDAPTLITRRYLEPYRSGHDCQNRTNCMACLSDASCGWCASSGTCTPRGGNETGPCAARGKMPELLVLDPALCVTCSTFIYCENCVSDPSCEWIVEGAYCVRRGRSSSAVRRSDLCPKPCHTRGTCASCLGDPGRCAWCEQTQTCFLFSTYTTSFMFAGCRQWVDEDHASPKGASFPGAQCPNCSALGDCRSCVQKLGCGWCSSDHNPFHGTCVPGDFSGPSRGSCNEHVIRGFPRLGSDDPVSWSYAGCPNVDECGLGLARCHADASCVDDAEGYRCICNAGFKGDGNTTCLKTCPESCVHGYCSEAPDYRCVCALGWTGARCDVDCGCHNHSRCDRGVGICDSCQDLTEGDGCQFCRRGSFGNATTTFGCRECSCNGHGDEEAGTCDSRTGRCVCLHDTEGQRCELCRAGFYGDPRNGGRCYMDCSPKGRTHVVAPGGLGSWSGAWPSRFPHCLWILETDSRINCGIKLTLLPGLLVRCPENHVYVYDGLPPFVSASGSHLLGAFCGTNASAPVTVASSGPRLSVYFRRSGSHEGFNATFRPASSCASAGPPRPCPAGCSADAGRGSCDEAYGLCRCKAGFGGSECSVALQPHYLSWALLFNTKRTLPSSVDVPRVHFGHSLLPLEPGQLWLYGGVAAVTTDSDALYVYDVDVGRWKQVRPRGARMPPGRRFHGAAMVGKDMYVFGGMNGTGVFGDFWRFATDEYAWTEVTTSPDVPALSGLTLTNVRDRWLVLVGGFSPKDGFQEKTLAYGIRNAEWKVLNTSGTIPVGIYGHTSNYHGPTESIYVFGGVLYDVDRTVVSDALYALHFPTGRWSKLPPDERANPAYSRVSRRYFHAAAVTDGTLFVMGGRNGSGGAILEPFGYDFSCNRWVALQDPHVQHVGEVPEATSGAAAVVLGGHLYLYGGSSERPGGLLYQLTLPGDVCTLFSASRLGCLRHVGCSYCSVQDGRGNHSHCYASSSSTPQSCIHHQGTLEVASGKTCDASWLDNRSCQQYNSCEDCLASWPAHPDAGHACEWCTSCRKGRCVRSNQAASCERAVDCDGPQSPLVSDPAQCPLRSCLASECEKCRDLGKCIWTRQAVRSSELRHTLNVRPIFDWTCVRRAVKDASSFPVESNPPRPCPTRCSQHSTCSRCLDSVGGEGGWHECWWSSARDECLTPSYAALRCEGGSCGSVLRGSAADACSPPCHVHRQAVHCLGDPRCGWCGFLGPGHNGHGVCMRGNADGPTGGVCADGNVFIEGHPLPANISRSVQTVGSRAEWFYFRRLPENECTNGHHTCDQEKEECVDLEDGFACECRKGYAADRETKECRPVCTGGCEHGVCTSPDVCRCHFGYVGRNCSLSCQCNGHSECAGPDRLDLCIKCHNRTMGPQCQLCEPFYVGNPAAGGRCVPCLEYCHQHTNICVEARQLQLDVSAAPTDFLQSFKQIEHGPTDTAECRFCQNNTTGRQCEECVEGYFIAGKNVDQGCRPCECHGHGHSCDWRTGENCDCKNNTENDRQCSSKNSKNNPTPCWHLQCSKCKENFQGVPTNGHQCYRHMRLEQDYCFDPETQDCSLGPNPLPLGRSVFFVVQPRYMNVDIRIVVDVPYGAADLYLSAREDTFVVDVNATNGMHLVSVDRKYAILDLVSDPDGRRRRAARNATAGDALWLRERRARSEGPVTYVRVRDPRELLLVRRLQNRLVITVPQDVYDLRSTRLYLVLVGAAEDAPLAIGSIFFRQDQTRIDLFVFFSVFFSCFFLFLAACVMVWKVKRAFDVRRARRLHAAQMEHMARRPFARVCFSVADDEAEIVHSPCRRKFQRRARDSPKGTTMAASALRPVAVEPTCDGAAAVTTVLVQLPGGLLAPVRLSLGSALVAARGGTGAVGFRAAMRRRTSHVNL